MRRVTIFTGSSTGNSPRYLNAVQDVARAIVESGYGIVFGGGNVGLMGGMADAALEIGGEVTGVMPQSLADREHPHQGLTQLEMVPDMHARKARMADLADAFIALPGGAGTLEELFEIWTWQQLRLHNKPVALYNIEGFWDPLLTMLDHMETTGFIRHSFYDKLIVADTPDALLTKIAFQL